MSRVSAEYTFNTAIGRIDRLSAPSTVSVVPIGTTGATSYSYRVSAKDASGETLASIAVTISNGNAPLSGTNFNRISWSLVQDATSYVVYGRTSGVEQRIIELFASHYDDTGAVSPSGSVPTINTTGYNSEKLSMGTLMYRNTGLQDYENWVGPYPFRVARPMESSTPIPGAFPHAIRWSDTIDWVFFADNSTAAATRRILRGTYNRVTASFAVEGFITITPPPATNHTIRGFRMSYDTYYTGTASATGTAVTGSGTAWSANRICVGSRIGFGSTSPQFITRWYEISAVGSDTSITLTGAVDATIPANTPYVIEDLRAVVVTTNATATNGGLFITKGLRPEIFTVAGTTIPAATTVDNIRATYWCADAVTATNTAAIGMGLDDPSSFTSQLVYVLDGTANCRVFVYDTRASLTSLSAGRTVSIFVRATGTQTLTGTASQLNNGRLATLRHGPGANEKSLYFTTTTRVYRALISNIVAGSTVWISDVMIEVPPGSANTFLATGALSSVEYSSTLDRLIINTTGAGGSRAYLTRYQSNVEQFDFIWGVETRGSESTAADINNPVVMNVQANSFSTWAEGGLAYITRNGATTTTNFIFIVPFGAHWGFQEVQPTQRIITPKILTPQCSGFLKAVPIFTKKYGSDRYAIMGEPFNAYYRIEGIEDNTGDWVQLDEDGHLSGVSSSEYIQYMFEFKTVGNYCIPAQIMAIETIYEQDDALPVHLQWNLSDSNNANGTVGFIQRGTYGSVPNLQINYYRSDNNLNLLTQSSTSSEFGVFQYWDEGNSLWVNGLGTDTDGLRRRFVPSSGLPSSTNVYAKIKVI